MVIVRDWDFVLWTTKYPDAFFIMDEAEEQIEKRLLDLQLKQIKGMSLFRDKNFFAYSATLDVYWRRAFKKVFDVGDDAMVEFPSVQKLKTGRDDDADILVLAYKTKNDAAQAMCDKIIEQGTHQPVICFTSEDDPVLRNYLESIVTAQLKGVPFLYIYNHDQAIEQMHASQELTKGVYVLHRDFARGYDIKFGTDAFVAILSENC